VIDELAKFGCLRPDGRVLTGATRGQDEPTKAVLALTSPDFPAAARFWASRASGGRFEPFCRQEPANLAGSPFPARRENFACNFDLAYAAPWVMLPEVSNWFGFSISMAAKRRAKVKSAAVLVAAAFVGLAPQTSFGETFYSLKGLLAEHFARAEKVSYRRVDLQPAESQRLESRLQARLPKKNWIIYRGEKGGEPTGYAFFDSEKGQHELMDLATFFDPSGKITRVELMTYREPYGDGVKSERFRQQFIGKSAASSFEPGRDIDTISGATISSKAMAKAVHRAALVLDAGLRNGAVQASAEASSTP
jgi:Na+-translocating ferredoxin:NAD+ oxidoreductase RnfG subunit